MLLAMPAVIDLMSPLWTPPVYPFIRPTFYDPSGAQWFFFVDLRGGKSIHNLDVIWNDEAKPFIPQRTSRLHYPEIDPQRTMGPTVRGQFFWKTPTPEHEHFTITLTSSAGTVYQDLRIERVSESWKIATRVASNGPLGRVLVACKDLAFPSTLGYADDLPRCWPDF